jgi:uncharacterized protein (TIGR03435 family)
VSARRSRFLVLTSLFVFLFGVRFSVQGFGVQGSAFEIVSVKENTGSDGSIRFIPHPPDGYRQTNLPLANYVTFAFRISQESRVDGMPEWAQTTRYDIAAKAAGPITDAERRLMLREVLANRFQLRTHIESREQTVYVMTAVRADKRLGTGLTLRTDCETTPCTASGTGTPVGLTIRGATLTQLADGMLSNIRGQVVRDETGIEGKFDITMTWRPESATDDSNDPRPSFFTAMQEQLGLKLEPQRRPVDVLVIDRLERPAPD